MRTALLLLTLLAAAVVQAAAPAAVLTLRESVACQGPSVQLGELFALGSAGDLDARRIAASPAPGTGSVLERSRLVRQLADWGWHGELKGPGQIRLYTPGVVVATAPLEAAVAANLAARLDSLGLRLSADPAGWPAELVCGSARLQWRLALLGDAPRAEGRAWLTLVDAAGFEQQLELSYHCLQPCQVGIATVDQPRGAVLSQWHLEERDAFAIRGEPLAPAALAGALLMEPLRAGAVITRRNAKPAPLVQAGREVDVRLTRGAVSVSLRGIAREDGALGDLVNVRHLDGRLQRRYRVAGPGLVEPSYVTTKGGST